MNIAKPRWDLIEIAINQAQSAGATVKFGDQSQLRTQKNQSIYIWQIEAYCDTVMPQSFITITNPVVNTADFLNTAATFKFASVERYALVPLIKMNPYFTGGTVPNVEDEFRIIDALGIDWEQSVIKMANASTTTPPFSYVFGITWDYTPPPGSRIGPVK